MACDECALVSGMRHPLCVVDVYRNPRICEAQDAINHHRRSPFIHLKTNRHGNNK
jgi:hypothetical protein